MSKRSNASATTTTNSTTCTPERISHEIVGKQRMKWNGIFLCHEIHSNMNSTSEYNSCTQRVREKIWNKIETRARRCSIEQHVALRSRRNPSSVLWYVFHAPHFPPFFIIFDSVAIIECLIINNFQRFTIAFLRPGYVVYNAQMAGWRPRSLRHGHDWP